ncbi:MAG: CopD family protein [Arcobacter sp.]|nr:CopD family protein [Arcobacter sp.]
MEEFFITFGGLIVFLHIISAVIWVGGMIAIRFAVHYSIQDIEDPKVKLGRTLELLRRFFNMVIPSIVVLLVTAVMMSIGLGLKETPLYPLVHIKETIWSVMTIIFAIIYIKRNKAQRFFDDGDLKSAKEKLTPLALWMIPTNIVLGLVALYLGVVLRGL